MSRHNPPVLNSPPVIKWLLVILVGIHVIQSVGPESLQIWIWQHFAFTPAVFTLSDQVEMSPLLYLGPLTHSFLHYDWMHLLMNSAMLLIFGTAVARMMGPWRTLLIFALGSLSGAMAHFMLTEGRLIFLMGASDSVSAFVGVIAGFSLIPGLRRFSPYPFNNMQFAVTFILIWSAFNLLPALGSILGIMADSNVSWQAHLGGFAVGALYSYGIYVKYK